MTSTEEILKEELAAVRNAMATGHVRLEIVPVYFQADPALKEAIQVFERYRVVQSNGRIRWRWRKAGPLLFRRDEQTLGDVFVMLCTMRALDQEDGSDG